MKKLLMFAFLFWSFSPLMQKVWHGPYNIQTDCEDDRKAFEKISSLVSPICLSKE